ncbi:MAG: hypothetical protein KIG14_03205, partial [Candidatus Sacchiramonaceae bacterium]|nr:hypothetical protein [Candidatus Saccharimonadaceae bacterium]
MKKSQVPPNKKYKRPSSKSAVIKKRLIFVGIGLILAPFLVFWGYETGRHDGWWGDSDSVKMLKREPIASVDFPSIDNLYYETTPPQEENFKTPPPYVRRWLGSDTLSQEETFREIIAFAEEDGWVKQEESFLNQYYWLGYKIDNKGRKMKLKITKIERNNEYYFQTFSKD